MLQLLSTTKLVAGEASSRLFNLLHYRRSTLKSVNPCPSRRRDPLSTRLDGKQDAIALHADSLLRICPNQAVRVNAAAQQSPASCNDWCMAYWFVVNLRPGSGITRNGHTTLLRRRGPGQR